MSDRGKSLLDDELAALLDGEPAERPADFDAALYLRLNQDVAAAVASGVYASGFEHYMKYGAKEGRRYRPALGEPVGPVVVSLDLSATTASRPIGAPRPIPAMPAHSIEALRVSTGGGLFIVGWIDDALDPLVELRLEGDGWALDVARLALARVRRRDVEAVLKSNQRHAYGYWAFVELCREIGNAPGLRTYVKREVMPGPLKGAALADFVRNAAGTYYHQTCTAKMGRDALSVVDGALKVYGVDGLRIADGSVMPFITTGNTMAPCVIIGERAAALIAAEHRL